MNVPEKGKDDSIVQSAPLANLPGRVSKVAIATWRNPSGAKTHASSAFVGTTEVVP
jgi:hypothetical protein